MPGYQKGTTPAGQMARMREAFALACAAIYAWPDAGEAWQAATELGELARNLQSEAGEFRGYLAAYMQDSHGLTTQELARFLGVSRPRAVQILKTARLKGNPVTEPTSLPEQPHVILAIVTSPIGDDPQPRVLVAQRNDRIPPFTFPGGDMTPGESSGDAARRKVRDETGLEVTATTFVGRRIHPKTSRVMVYVHATVSGTDAVLGDPADLADVRWMTVDETRDAMPDMYSPVRQYLDQLQMAAAADSAGTP